MAMPTCHTSWEWVADFLLDAGGCGPGPAADPAGPCVALVMINTPLSEPRLRQLWALTKYHICADGAANRLNKSCPDLLPDFIVGDLDSATPDVLQTYKSRGVEVLDLSHDQDSTDLEKALAVVKGRKFDKIVVAGAFAGVDGRLDHTFGIANTLFLNPDMDIAVVGDDCFMFLLGPGEHTIVVPHAAGAPHCGLVPIGKACTSISTTGLRWNMTDQPMEFGGLVSVCNRVDPAAAGGRVWVKADTHVLWTCSRVQS
mmetsp:Transcript_84097/g.238572  ORF Transcript_84097/g.238572 Transcript_84097/m.238572 type:complete len:257 (-) Transcript_84097:48-818(-)